MAHDIRIVTEAELRTGHNLDHNVAEESVIQLIGMNKWYGDFHVLRDINLDVRKGERIVAQSTASSVISRRKGSASPISSPSSSRA